MRKCGTPISELNVENMIISPTRHDTQRPNGLTFPAYLSLPCFHGKVLLSFHVNERIINHDAWLNGALSSPVVLQVGGTDCASRVRQHSFVLPPDSSNIHFRVSFLVAATMPIHVALKLNPISISHPENPSSFCNFWFGVRSMVRNKQHYEGNRKSNLFDDVTEQKCR